MSASSEFYIKAQESWVGKHVIDVAVGSIFKIEYILDWGF